MMAPEATETARRLVAYIDGFNLYHGMKERRWRRFYWLDVWALTEKLLPPGHILSAVRYYTARISGPTDKRK